ncbi:sigma-70 family RNA polymerase sigma factor [Paraburkholderia acidisoli]|uniref:Sigma-70 family RNA polymerase sigma factor n=1 Tax=Paraburkholderia acidisoli TaxID=2571748 RepID=A0A7Z2GRR0_9BURK|nr:sigma-70 family RNA polymerase sigma factor [Paraburkholderia acidisoli]QGZ66748.1 sigma-70 family RNA polymerase sigma factor [Paraburkholderia acidisoli]
MPTLEFPVQQDLHTLYGDHHGWLKSWLQRRLGNAADAGDLAHDVFLRLIVKPASRGFATPAEARAYLRVMAKGLCTDHWRRREIEQAWLDTLAAQPEPIEPSPEFRAMVIETILEIGTLLARLSDKAQRAFVLAQIYGFSTPEIAAELAVSARMVQKYLASAMLQLALVDAGLTQP